MLNKITNTSSRIALWAAENQGSESVAYMSSQDVALQKVPQLH